MQERGFNRADFNSTPLLEPKKKPSSIQSPDQSVLLLSEFGGHELTKLKKSVSLKEKKIISFLKLKKFYSK
jgi:hypothetical protein